MKRFVTTYYKNGTQYGGHVDALDFEHAQQICDQRDLNETVDGILMCVIKTENFSAERANKLCEAFANSVGIEPPEAEEFDR